MVAVAFGFSGVVEEQSQVEHVGTLKAVKQWRIGIVRGGFGFPDAVELFDAHQSVFIGRILMIELMLDKAGELAEFGDVFAEHIDVMHRAKDGRDASALAENSQKAFADMLVGKE